MKTPRDTMRRWRLLAGIAIASTVLSLAPLRPARSDFDCINSTCGALAGPVTCADGRHVNAPFDCNALCGNPSQDLGTLCATFDGNPCLEAVCGSAGECGNAQQYVPPSCNDNDTCTTDTCDACANDCSGACVHEPDLSAALSGPVTCADGRHVNAPFDCNALCGNPSQDLGTLCATFDDNLCLEAVCGSAGECGNARTYVPPSCNDNSICTTDTCDACADNRGGACAHQPDLGVAGCNLPAGDPCSGGLQCASRFCVDGVCCDRACNGPSETCNLSGRLGRCIAPGPAPVVSGRGVVIISCVLMAIGLWSLRRAVIRPRG